VEFVKKITHFEHQALALLLLLLHTLIWYVDYPPLRASLTLVLYGLFFLWQPLWSKETRVNRPSQMTALLALLAFSYFYLNESLVFFGLTIAGLIGSRLFSNTANRAFDLTALAILILEMAIGIVPLTFDPIQLPTDFDLYFQFLLLGAILIIFFAPLHDTPQTKRSQVDLMHGVLSATLIFLSLLGGIVINLLYGVDYLDGLLLTVFLVSTLALGISWFWNPGVGYSGLGVLWNRYAMTIGSPFETWINTLTILIEEPYISAQEFLQAACEHLVEHDWLNGIHWHFNKISVAAGSRDGVLFTHPIGDRVEVAIYFKSDPGQALQQHTILLLRMAYQFYIAKLTQEKMRAQEHFETIHHTGARLTHDIKNILQSIKTSISIVQTQPGDPEKTARLLHQNLGQISERLESTLQKLKTPQLNTSLNLVSIEQWSRSLMREKSCRGCAYHVDIQYDHHIPQDLFDSVINNLLSNAQRKKESSEIIVQVIANPEMVNVTVCDNGNRVTGDTEQDLFKKPVSSGEGMGIGLYQSAIMARTLAYELELTSNQDGKVCFSLYQHLGE
jgi:signal transduction histidine kinase